MKKTAIIAAIALAVVGGGYGLATAHSGSDRGWGGHMGYGDHMGYGRHMMDDYRGEGYGRDYGYCGSYDRDEAREDLTEQDARDLITSRVVRSNPNLKVGKVKSTEDGFEVQVLTKKGEALVDRLLVEKDTGRVYRVYE